VDPLRSATSITRVVPALFRRLDGMIAHLSDVEGSTAGMSDDVAQMRRELTEVLQSIHADTTAMARRVDEMATDVESLSNRMGALEDSLASVDAFVGRFSRRGRRAQREAAAAAAAAETDAEQAEPSLDGG
jgi:septal ring factor EnvC (AmiA/AmiB activator)